MAYEDKESDKGGVEISVAEGQSDVVGEEGLSRREDELAAAGVTRFSPYSQCMTPKATEVELPSEDKEQLPSPVLKVTKAESGVVVGRNGYDFRQVAIDLFFEQLKQTAMEENKRQKVISFIFSDSSAAREVTAAEAPLVSAAAAAPSGTQQLEEEYQAFRTQPQREHAAAGERLATDLEELKGLEQLSKEFEGYINVIKKSEEWGGVEKSNKANYLESEVKIMYESEHSPLECPRIDATRSKIKALEQETKKGTPKESGQRSGIEELLTKVAPKPREARKRWKGLKSDQGVMDRMHFYLTRCEGELEVGHKNLALQDQELEFQSEGRDFSVEVLSGPKVLESMAFGLTTPCCLKVPASGSKYLYGIMFDPDISMAVIRDSKGHVLTTALVSSHEEDGKIGFWHLDKSKDAKNMISPETIKMGYQALGCKMVREGKATEVYWAPGEASVVNMLAKDVVGLGNRCKRLGIMTPSEMEGKLQTALEEQGISADQVEATTGSGRTDVRGLQKITFVLENSEKLVKIPEVREELANWMSSIMGYERCPSRPVVDLEKDVFRLSRSEGHGLCDLHFRMVNKERLPQRLLEIYDSSLRARNGRMRPLIEDSIGFKDCEVQAILAMDTAEAISARRSR